MIVMSEEATGKQAEPLARRTERNREIGVDVLGRMTTDFTTAPLALALRIGRRVVPWKSLRGLAHKIPDHFPVGQVRIELPPHHRKISCIACRDYDFLRLQDEISATLRSAERCPKDTNGKF